MCICVCVVCVCVCAYIIYLKLILSNQKENKKYKPETSLLNVLEIFLWVPLIVIIIATMNAMLYVSLCVSFFLYVHVRFHFPNKLMRWVLVSDSGTRLATITKRAP